MTDSNENREQITKISKSIILIEKPFINIIAFGSSNVF